MVEGNWKMMVSRLEIRTEVVGIFSIVHIPYPDMFATLLSHLPRCCKMVSERQKTLNGLQGPKRDGTIGCFAATAQP